MLGLHALHSHIRVWLMLSPGLGGGWKTPVPNSGPLATGGPLQPAAITALAIIALIATRTRRMGDRDARRAGLANTEESDTG